ncbi:hypothetical protein [uncultured Aquimarina sp.]|uniref:hypothetical protein n=1 Tax=uncultured Aquimarina sp. TaxID=575652 RepID=UPI002638D7A8|nr:hypothetical protein [uncultured Aquimarina sp.]
MNQLIITSGIALSFILFQLIFPYRSPKNLDFSKIEENKKKFNRLEKMAVLWIFLSLGFISFLVFILGTNLVDILFSNDYEYIMKPSSLFWFLPGLILGFGFLRVPMDFIYKLYLKNDYYLYKHFTNMKHGFDGEKIWRPLELIFSITGMVFFILGLNWFVRINSNQIEINELFNLRSKTYKIENIVSLAHSDIFLTQKGKSKSIDHYVIGMNDEYKWSSHVFGFFALKKDKELLGKKIKELSDKKGLAIKEVQH